MSRSAILTVCLLVTGAAACGLGALINRSARMPAAGEPEPPEPAAVLELADKRVEVDITRQRLRAYQAGSVVFEFPVSAGKHNKTPQGSFTIWKKHRKKDMKVGLPILGRYYTLEDVPWILYY